MNKFPKNNEETAPSGITRKEAMEKLGKYVALSTISTFIILDPKKAQASSASPSPSPSPGGGDSGGADDDTPPPPPGWGG